MKHEDGVVLKKGKEALHSDALSKRRIVELEILSAIVPVPLDNLVSLLTTLTSKYP